MISLTRRMLARSSGAKSRAEYLQEADHCEPPQVNMTSLVLIQTREPVAVSRAAVVGIGVPSARTRS